MITSFERATLAPPAPPAKGSVISIGVFDGVHLGHRAILEANVATAAELGAMPTVVTFRRHPKRLLLGRAPRTLTTLEHRLELFARAGIGHAVVLNFDEALRDMSAAEFAREVCVEGLALRRLVLGFDSKFGRDRDGTPQTLRELGYEVEVVPKVVVRGRAVSSTAIREAVELGDLVGAAAMLGRPVSVFGRVVHGDARGREIGFPTANLVLRRRPPIAGIFVVEALAEGESRLRPGVASVGRRPTVNPSALPLLEVHLLDFAGDLYRRHLRVRFLRKLRDERKYDDVPQLRAAIAQDAEAARRYFATKTNA